MLERKGRMMLPLRLYKRIVGGLWGIERAEVEIFPVNPNAGLPFSGPKRARTHKARSTIASNFSLVPAVVLRRHVSEIAQPIVRRVAVDMVDIAARPDAVDIKPGKPVFAVVLAQQAYAAVALRHCNISRLSPSYRKLVARDAVCKNSCVGVVMQNFFQVVLRDCKFGFSHYIAPSKRRIGQGIGAGANCLFPRNIIGEMG